MLQYFFVIATILQLAFSAPQLVTFKEGKVGVNLGGYHASAGLGSILTGNPAHGGLSASAGTPWGQNAGAGVGGRVAGRSSGLLYAGAEAIPSVGASAVLGGDTNKHGFAASEAHANGNTISKTVGDLEPITSTPVLHSRFGSDEDNTVQKISPPKKYHLIKPEVPDSVAHSKAVQQKTYEAPQYSDIQYQQHPDNYQPQQYPVVHPGIKLGFDIPIGILQTIQNALYNLPPKH